MELKNKFRTLIKKVFFEETTETVWKNMKFLDGGNKTVAGQNLFCFTGKT